MASSDVGAGSDVPASSTPVTAARNRVKIVPPAGWQRLDLAELWRYRELTWFLAMRDVRVRYKQTALGVVWVVLQPLLQTFIFTLVFNRFAGVNGWAGAPYWLAVFCGMVVWQLFEAALTNAGNSLVGSQNLITKVYFPRLAVPISTVLAALVDFVISFALLLILMAVYRHPPGIALLLMPIFVLLTVAAALAAGLWLSALNVQYRDVRYVIPFLARILLFITPVFYPASLIEEKLGKLAAVVYGLNPMAGAIEGFRWCVLGTEPPPVLFLFSSGLATAVVLVSGTYYFRRMEQVFADVV